MDTKEAEDLLWQKKERCPQGQQRRKEGGLLVLGSERQEAGAQHGEKGKGGWARGEGQDIAPWVHFNARPVRDHPGSHCTSLDDLHLWEAFPAIINSELHLLGVGGIVNL